MPEIEIRSAAAYSLGDLASLINRAFTDYVGGTFDLDASRLAAFLTTHGVNLALSQVTLQNGAPVAVALISRRGATSRLTMMGVVPEAQQKGIGSRVMRYLIQQARSRADKQVDLEVIEQNPAGIRLYQKVGFTRVNRLLEFSLESPAGEYNALEDVDIFSAARLLSEYEDPDTPWQAGSFNLATLAPPNKAFKLGSACAVISNPKADGIILHSVAVAPDERHQGHGSALLRALFYRYPKKTWRVIAVCPERYTAFLEQLEFTRGELSQFHMRLELD